MSRAADTARLVNCTNGGSGCRLMNMAGSLIALLNVIRSRMYSVAVMRLLPGLVGAQECASPTVAAQSLR